MKSQSLLLSFVSRWAVSSLGLWLASLILGDANLSVGHSWTTVLGAGFFLAVISMLLKPLLVFLSIPMLLLTLGFFMLIVNGLTIMIAAWIYDPLYVKNIWIASVAGIILGLVNFFITKLVEEKK